MHALAEQVFVHAAGGGLILPGEGFVGVEFFDEALGGRGVLVGVDEDGGDIRHFAGFESVAENEGEDGREDEEENEDAAVAIDVEEFFARHAHDRAEGAAVHEANPWLKGGTPNAERRTSNAE